MRRLFYWYAQLKALEASFDADPMDRHLAEKQAKIEQIEDAVSHIRIPLTFPIRCTTCAVTLT